MVPSGFFLPVCFLPISRAASVRLGGTLRAISFRNSLTIFSLRRAFFLALASRACAAFGKFSKRTLGVVVFVRCQLPVHAGSVHGQGVDVRFSFGASLESPVVALAARVHHGAKGAVFGGVYSAYRVACGFTGHCRIFAYVTVMWRNWA